jgi:hypothetical protein
MSTPSESLREQLQNMGVDLDDLTMALSNSLEERRIEQDAKRAKVERDLQTVKDDLDGKQEALERLAVLFSGPDVFFDHILRDRLIGPVTASVPPAERLPPLFPRRNPNPDFESEFQRANALHQREVAGIIQPVEPPPRYIRGRVNPTVVYQTKNPNEPT